MKTVKPAKNTPSAKAKKPRSLVVQTAAKQRGFLAMLAQCCNVGKSCAAVGIDRSTAYTWREKDADFAAAWEKALQIGISALEDEAHRRAFDGVDEPVFYQGEVCGAVKKYSDTLAIFLLKAHNPDKYRDNARLELSGRVEMSEAIVTARMRMNRDDGS